MPNATDERIVDSRDVHDLLGIRKPTVARPTLDVSINLRKLNITDPGSPGFGEWVDRRAVLRWMEAYNRKAGGSRLVETMIRQYRELMEL